jgi:hypothetical protein
VAGSNLTVEARTVPGGRDELPVFEAVAIFVACAYSLVVLGAYPYASL